MASDAGRIPARPDWYFDLLEPVADVILAAMPVPLRLLDVGCGTGELLRELVVRVPYGQRYVGIDSSAAALAAARAASDTRIEFLPGEAGALPLPDASFDLVLACGSFGGWPDQRRGVEELARVVTDTGKVVLVDAPRRGDDRVRTPKDVEELITGAGLRVERRETVGRKFSLRTHVRAFIASP